MMEATLREYLNNRYKPDEIKPSYCRYERFVALVDDYFSSKGMEWTADDEQAVRDYGFSPGMILDFNDEQFLAIDAAETAVSDLVHKLLTTPKGMTIPNSYKTEENITWEEIKEIMNLIAGHLASKGYAVYLPIRREKNGVKYISDLYEKE